MPSIWRSRSHDVDDYYRLTAYLAARDVQTRVCRVIAAVIAVLGLIPLVMMASSAGPRGVPSHGVGVAITVSCLVMAAWWLRPCWPSRWQSQGTVVLGAVCIAAACFITSSPVVGLLGANTFALLSAFVMFCHSPRLLTFTWAVGAATMGVLALRVAAVDVVLAVCAVALVAVVNVFVALASRTAIRLEGTVGPGGGIEPLTGLRNRESFDEQVATMIGARSRGDDLYLVVLVVFVDGLSPLTATKGDMRADRARVAIAQCLRDTVRRDAVLAHVGQAEYFVAELFTTPDPEPLAERIRSAVRTAGFRSTASIGAVSTPLHPLNDAPAPEVAEELLTIASSAMYAARAGGGNQVHLRVSPPLSVLHPPRENWDDTEDTA